MIQKAVERALRKVLNIKEGGLDILGSIEKTKEKLLDTQKELSSTKIELEEVKALKKREETEIKHNVKMVTEKNEIEMEKAKQKVISDYQLKELELMKTHQGALNKLMETNLVEMKSMYDKISDTLASAVQVDISKTN